MKNTAESILEGMMENDQQFTGEESLMPTRRYFWDAKQNHLVYYCGSLPREEREAFLSPFKSDPPLPSNPFPLPKNWPVMKQYLMTDGKTYTAAKKRQESDIDISCRNPWSIPTAWITIDGRYYMGDRSNENDIEVPIRPTNFHAWNGIEWVFDIEIFCQHIRERRNGLLSITDWTDLPNAPLTIEQKAAWQVYRQALRDLPANTMDEDIIWPTPPDDKVLINGGIEING